MNLGEKAKSGIEWDWAQFEGKVVWDSREPLPDLGKMEKAVGNAIAHLGGEVKIIIKVNLEGLRLMLRKIGNS